MEEWVMDGQVLEVGSPVEDYPAESLPSKMDDETNEAYRERLRRAQEDLDADKALRVVDAPVQQSLFEWAGKRPGVVKLKLSCPALEVAEGFKKGTEIKFSGTAVVVSEGAEDKLDKETMTVVEAEQTHKAVVLAWDVEAVD